MACGVLVSTWCGRKKHVASVAHRRKRRETEAVDASPNIPSSAMAPAREEQRKLRANGGGEFYPAPRSRVKKLFGDRWFEGVVDEVAPGDRFPITVRFDDGDVESFTLEQFHASTTPATAARTATATTRTRTPAPAASSRAYLRGLGNEHASESLPGALPEGRNNPARCPYGLYAEQISGTAFTAPRSEGKNLRTWMYRKKPSVTHEPFKSIEHNAELGSKLGERVIADFAPSSRDIEATPNQLRWFPRKYPEVSKMTGNRIRSTFIGGLETVCGAGSAATKDGYAIHTYACGVDMVNDCFANADGDMLIVPEKGTLDVQTELGRLEVPPGFVCVVPRGIRFRVTLPEIPQDGEENEPDADFARGYVLEVFSGHFELPDLGLIGANGLASARDFEMPTAYCDDDDAMHRARDAGEWAIVHKFLGEFFEAKQSFSPFNVVAWHGNYVPFRYDLSKFCPMNSVSFDHADPSIFTVLTVRGGSASRPGAACADFVVFPPRVNPTADTFRPPYYHRNSQTEYMGLIRGQYEAKVDGGFLPGGGMLHSCMTPHGPDAETFARASSPRACDEAGRIGDDALAFMFECDYAPRVSKRAMRGETLDENYYKVWSSLRSYFDANDRDGTIAREGGGRPPVAPPPQLRFRAENKEQIKY